MIVVKHYVVRVILLFLLVTFLYHAFFSFREFSLLEHRTLHLDLRRTRGPTNEGFWERGGGEQEVGWNVRFSFKWCHSTRYPAQKMCLCVVACLSPRVSRGLFSFFPCKKSFTTPSRHRIILLPSFFSWTIRFAFCLFIGVITSEYGWWRISWRARTWVVARTWGKLPTSSPR